MTSDVLLPQSARVQAGAFFLVVGATLAGALCWFWSGARSGDAGFRRGYHQGWQKGHERGWVQGVADAGVLDRLVALDELQQDAEFQQAAGMRRSRAAVEAWNAEGRKWA